MEDRLKRVEEILTGNGDTSKGLVVQVAKISIQMKLLLVVCSTIGTAGLAALVGLLIQGAA